MSREWLGWIIVPFVAPRWFYENVILDWRCMLARGAHVMNTQTGKCFHCHVQYWEPSDR